MYVVVAPMETMVMETGRNELPWTPEEQKLLEQALRTYPNGTPERWDKIAGCLPTRSKKDCMMRFKVTRQHQRVRDDSILPRVCPKVHFIFTPKVQKLTLV